MHLRREEKGKMKRKRERERDNDRKRCLTRDSRTWYKCGRMRRDPHTTAAPDYIENDEPRYVTDCDRETKDGSR